MTKTEGSFSSRLSPQQRADILNRLAVERKHAIDTLLSDGDGVESRMDATLRYDLEMAPRVTQRSQLERIGYSFPPHEYAAAQHPAGADSCDIAWLPNTALVNALAELNVFVVNTGGIDNLTLYQRLVATLADIVPDLPPSDGVQEYLDMMGVDKDPRFKSV